jgi:NADPH-dependent curcumin reductase CurA
VLIFCSHRRPVSHAREQLLGQLWRCRDQTALPYFKVNISSRRDLKNAKFMEPGTGGVSMFALLICLAAGIRPIITSSSNKKLAIARSLGQPGEVDIINYRSHPEWDKRALHLTHGRGVDVVVEM